MLQRRSGFTMIELVFVIVVLGILAAIAVPRFAATREDAVISAGAATVSAVRSGIVGLRQRNILAGTNDWPLASSISGDTFGVLAYPVAMGSNGGEWSDLGGGSYRYTILAGRTVVFTYNANNGNFDCVAPLAVPSADCARLTGR